MLSDLSHLLDEDSFEALSELVRDSHMHEILYLHRACKAGSYNTIHLLLRAGANPNVGDDDGNGPLHVSASMLNPNDDAVPCLLLDSGTHLDWIENPAKPE